MAGFQVGVTRDFLDEGGNLTYRDVGLGLIDGAANVAYRFLPDLRTPVAPHQVADVDAMLSLIPAWTADTFAEGADRLLVVARFGVGYDMCDVPALTRNDVLLTITSGATDLPVAGGVLTMMLALSRRLFAKDRLVREGRWQDRGQYMGSEIGGRTLGIVGFGGAGRKLRELVAPFEMRVLAFDPYVPEDAMRRQGVEPAGSLGDLFADADYVSIHCLLNDDTRGLIDRGLFSRMKPTAYFLNAARGPIVNEPDLVDALQAGKIAGAGLDVFEEEPPPPDHPLFALENVILAPHAICWTHECFQAIGETAVRSILAVSRGEKPFGLVNPEVWESSGFQRKLRLALARRG
jgi:phosphoglycerate dehydrogenase-like enzyme